MTKMKNPAPKDLGRIDWKPRLKVWSVIWYRGRQDIPMGDYLTREEAATRLQELIKGRQKNPGPRPRCPRCGIVMRLEKYWYCPGCGSIRNPISLYQAFHGIPESRKTKVYYEEPPKEVIAIGELRQLNYRPIRGQHKNQEFYHKSGDTGESKLKTNLILATDKHGRNLYLVKKDKSIKRPVFTGRGIIG